MICSGFRTIYSAGLTVMTVHELGAAGPSADMLRTAVLVGSGPGWAAGPPRSGAVGVLALGLGGAAALWATTDGLHAGRARCEQQAEDRCQREGPALLSGPEPHGRLEPCDRR